MSNWALHMENGKLILAGRAESKELIDFQDKYTNLCHISREIQVDLYTQLWNIITQVGLTEESCVKQLVMHALLIRTISAVSYPLNILIMGDEIFIKNSVQYADVFNKENIVCTLPIEEDAVSDKSEFIPSLTEYIRMVGNEYKNRCDVIFIDYWMIRDNIEDFLVEIDNISSFEGLVFLYSAPNDIREWKNFSLEEQYALSGNNTIYLLKSKKMCVLSREQKEVLSVYQRDFRLIQLQWEEIKSLAIGENFSKGKDMEEKIDKLILLTLRIEKFINRNYNMIVNKETKFEINELKNALLDLRYHSLEELDYFLEAVNEQINSIM